jgi:hypothetical protein
MVRNASKYSFGWGSLLSCVAMMWAIQMSACETVRYLRPDGTNVTMLWSQAGADFEPHISSACTSMISAASRDQCSSALRHLFLAADLKLWNAIDGRNLTWQQRPPRELPGHLQNRFTMGGSLEHLRAYRCDSHSYRVAYSTDDITALIDKARARNAGTAYPQIDIRLFSSTAPSPLQEHWQSPSTHHRSAMLACTISTH